MRDPHSPVEDTQNILANMQGSIWNGVYSQSLIVLCSNAVNRDDAGS